MNEGSLLLIIFLPFFIFFFVVVFFIRFLEKLQEMMNTGTKERKCNKLCNKKHASN
jgi:hypothetical protein